MNVTLDEFIVWTISRYRRPDSLAMFTDKVRALLNELRTVDRQFENLIVIGKEYTTAISCGCEDFDLTIQSHAFDPRHAEDYMNLVSGRPGPETLSKIGFSLSFFSMNSARELLAPEDGGFEIKLQGSSARAEANASAVLRLHGRSIVRHPSILRSFLSLLVDRWQCDLGGVYVPKYREAICSLDRASYAGQWLYYLPFPHLATCLPADIHHEPFANGILIETTPHMPDANNPADIAAGHRVREVLDEFGLVNDATYAIEGWPPDTEESLYEQFISGAPEGRKYTVNCINFDGYDADRKVLLYAKLFRRLKKHPKEWGLRGWDGPVLNEAKRQVRAAAKAGGVPIEWHIGLEEPAQQVCQLLSDYTDITEEQLSVVYTPLRDALKSKPPT